MRFLSVAERELRAASRRAGMYRIRWITASIFFLLLLWMAWGFDLFQNRNAGPQVFRSFSVAIFFYCLFVAAGGTADCISREKREGTLGLLFLTNLNSAEIVVGKLCSNGLMLIYSLLAIFPVLALPVLIGGVSFGELGRTILALANGLFFGIAAGFVASAICVRQFPVVALATSMVLIFGVGPLGVAAVLTKMQYPKFIAEAVAAFCPLNTLIAANDAQPFFNPRNYWRSLGAVAAMSFTWLLLVTWSVGRTWRDRPKNIPAWRRFGLGENFRKRARASRQALRRRLLEINPIFWLAGRQRISAPIFMLITVALVLITATITVPFFGRIIGAGVISPLIGHLVAWLWTTLAIHALVLYYGATIASQRLAEDKQTGALELILSTPTSERAIGRGLWLAYGRKMLFPALVAVLAHLFFFWQGAVAFLAEPSEDIPRNITTWQFVVSALRDQSIHGFRPEWPFGFMLRVLLLALVVLMSNWFMLGWVGRWLGLRMKHPGFAPMVSVILALVPPTAIFSFLCYLSSEWNLDHMPDRLYFPMMMWVGFGIGIGNSVVLSAWAAGKLRREFRTTVTSRFQPAPLRQSWRPSRKGMRRFATVSGGVVVMLFLMGPLFYGCQTWKSGRKWTAFQNELKQRGESLDFSALMPAPVPDEKNFARSLVFQKLSHNTASENPVASLLATSVSLSERGFGSAGNADGSWMQQAFWDFDEQLGRIVPHVKRDSIKDRTAAAMALWNALKPLEEDFAAVTKAEQLPFFQLGTNRNPETVYRTKTREASVMQGLHFLFQLRACVLLELDRSPEAAEDVITSLRLARLAGQLPNVKSSARVQIMLARSLQPIWEGLAKHRWSEPQLAAMQNELAAFDLLSNHTNAVRRVTLAYVETWRAAAQAKSAQENFPRASGEWDWQPRAWWLDKAIELYRVAQESVARVDVAAGKVDSHVRWVDLSGLPLDEGAIPLLQQSPWNVSPALVSFAQTAVNQGVIACALERYRLARGVYPETLEPLLHDHLNKIPNDIKRGLPMFYRLNQTNNYVLRGVGLNGFIDQGKAPSDDWVWSFLVSTNR